ncbi:uncharacterized protein EAE97_007006 [Botrytis byssoidea]|uniref:Peptidase M16 middle/third domain-containing protein n=1 Tax=Botrytis byssoidea TaxID=139641 RepID=A0A9P5IL97_9HELO|nr:uncharacterized protein EAE97_007006 [Botrytis byssoidea]KAF7940820.1 hypothetical protein EAE97_007006 [Botrytis byssoidea]
MNNFAAGNYQCLHEIPVSRGVNVRKRFIEFYYKAYYSANSMKLVVLGREPLQELESWVQELFSNVPNKNLHRLRWDGIPVLDEPELMTQIFVKPVMELRLLNIHFTYPDEEELFDSHPSRYLEHLIGHEGPGSALAYLKELGLADYLSAEATAQCPGTVIFCIETRLTEDGMQQYREVIKIIFQYIAMLKESPPLTWISDEMSRLAEVEFKFRQKLPPSRTVSGLAQAMQEACIPREHLLSTSLIRKFDPENIERGLSHLRPDNFRFFVVDQQFPGDWNVTEQWYENKYKLEKIPEDFMQELWATSRAPIKERLSRVHLPAVNEFIPQRLEVERNDIPDPARYPTLIRHDDDIRVWFKKDDQFWVPKANIRLFLRSPVASVTPMNTIMTQIAGLNYSISESAHGLNIEIDGFNDKMLVLLEKLLLGVRDLNIKKERFNVVKEKARKMYKKFDYREPYRQINAFSRMLISERSWAPFEMLEELQAVTAEDLRSYSHELLRQMHIELLVHGNSYREEALSIAELVQSKLHPHRLPEAQWPPRRAIALPSGVNYLYERVLKNPDNVNHCLEYIISVGSISDRVQRAKLLLFAQIANEPCFNTLRTKEQLGYIINSEASVYAAVGTWCILVQSERDCKYLEERCDAFLMKLEQTLRAMTNETLEELKIGLVNKRLEKLKNLGQEALRFWNHITSEVFDFEQVYCDAENIEALTKNDILEFFNQYIHPYSPTGAKLSIHLIAQASTGVSAAAKNTAAAENNIKVSTFNAEQEIIAVHDHEASVSSVKIPVKIEDVRAWKASLRLSAATTPVKSLIQWDVVASPAKAEKSRQSPVSDFAAAEQSCNQPFDTLRSPEHWKAAGMSTGIHGQEPLKRYDKIKDRPHFVTASKLEVVDAELNVMESRSIPSKLTNWKTFYYRLRANFDGLKYEYVPKPPPSLLEEGQVVFYDVEKRVTDVSYNKEGELSVTYEGVQTEKNEVLHPDLVIAADGTGSVTRNIVFPNLKTQYAGFLTWRGIVPESAVSKGTINFLFDRCIRYHADRHYIVVYLIPGDDGDIKPGERHAILVWYDTCHKDSPEIFL